MEIIRLIKKAQKGNDKAFLKLFQQYENDIYRMAYVYVKNKEDALDVVQEVAYQSFKKIDTLKQPEYFKIWLMKITINCSINIVKKNKKLVHLYVGSISLTFQQQLIEYLFYRPFEQPSIYRSRNNMPIIGKYMRENPPRIIHLRKS